MERVAGCWWNDWPDVGGTRGRMAWNTQTEASNPILASSDAPVNEKESAKADDEIVTTNDELQAFMIVRAIAAEHLPLDRVHLRDSKSYCAILIDDNNRKPLCRLYFNSKSTRYIGIFDGGKNEVKEVISDLRQIYAFSARIRATAAHYLGATKDTAAEEDA